MYHDENQEVHRGNIPENHESKRKRVDDQERGKWHDFMSYTIIKNNFIVYILKMISKMLFYPILQSFLSQAVESCTINATFL